jgi:hypothetical protein
MPNGRVRASRALALPTMLACVCWAAAVAAAATGQRNSTWFSVMAKAAAACVFVLVFAGYALTAFHRSAFPFR